MIINDTGTVQRLQDEFGQARVEGTGGGYFAIQVPLDGGGSVWVTDLDGTIGGPGALACAYTSDGNFAETIYAAEHADADPGDEAAIVTMIVNAIKSYLTDCAASAEISSRSGQI